jgi:hypothetical protein
MLLAFLLAMFSIAAIPYGRVFVASGFMDQQKTTFAIASMG